MREQATASFFFSSRRRHTRYIGDWSSDVCSSDLLYCQIPRRFIQFGRILSFSIGFRGSQRTMPGWWPPCTCMASRPSSPSIRLDSPATPALKVFIPPKPPLERRTMHKNAQSRTTAPPPPTRKARHRSSPLDLSIWALIVQTARHNPDPWPPAPDPGGRRPPPGAQSASPTPTRWGEYTLPTPLQPRF